MFSLHVTFTSDSWICGRVLGTVQGGTKMCVRQCAKKAAKFALHKNCPNWESLASRRKVSSKHTLGNPRGML